MAYCAWCLEKASDCRCQGNPRHVKDTWESARLLGNALVDIIWLLDSCDKPPAVPPLIAEELRASLQKARELVGSPEPPAWSCYVRAAKEAAGARS